MGFISLHIHWIAVRLSWWGTKYDWVSLWYLVRFLGNREKKATFISTWVLGMYVISTRYKYWISLLVQVLTRGLRIFSNNTHSTKTVKMKILSRRAYRGYWEYYMVGQRCGEMKEIAAVGGKYNMFMTTRFTQYWMKKRLYLITWGAE